MSIYLRVRFICGLHMPPCCLFSKHAPGHNRTHTLAYNDTTRTQTNEAHTHKRIVRALTHPAWRTSFDLVIFLSLADNQQAMWLAASSCVLCHCRCRCWCWYWCWGCANALHVAQLAVCALPTIFVCQVAPIVLAPYFLLSPFFCCLIFIFVLPAIPFLATVRVAAVLVIVVG